jgi:hypothetical protein
LEVLLLDQSPSVPHCPPRPSFQLTLLMGKSGVFHLFDLDLFCVSRASQEHWSDHVTGQATGSRSPWHDSLTGFLDESCSCIAVGRRIHALGRPEGLGMLSCIWPRRHRIRPSPDPREGVVSQQSFFRLIRMA